MFDFTEEEKNALREKFDNPSKDVVCPRCGKTLVYREKNGSSEVKCETPGCIHGTVRGL